MAQGRAVRILRWVTEQAALRTLRVGGTEAGGRVAPALEVHVQ